jgi:hypothetical protein
MSKRERPEDGGVVWHGRLNAFECLGCDGMLTVRSHRVWNNPERLAAFRELMVLDHAECWQYADARLAAQARRFRKERVRRQLLAAQAAKTFDKMAATVAESSRSLGARSPSTAISTGCKLTGITYLTPLEE